MSAPYRFERAAWRLGLTRVAGVDEAGRGPLAGPVVAAAVVLLGRDGDESITCEHLAEWVGTIPYEVLTNINNRVPRVYV